MFRNKEKKAITESKMKEDEQIQSFEDKCNHLNKLKIRLEKSLDEVEDSWEREKKQKCDVEKLKRQVEGNLKLTQETISDLERHKIETGQVLQTIITIANIKVTIIMVMLPGAAAQGEGEQLAQREDRGRAHPRWEAQHPDQGVAGSSGRGGQCAHWAEELNIEVAYFSAL